MTRPDKRGWSELVAGLTEIFGSDAVNKMRRYDLQLPPLGATIGELKDWFFLMKEARSCPQGEQRA